jgi:hypothetical protein
VRQGPLDDFPCVAIQHGNRLLGSVQITSYNPHLGLLRPERCGFGHAQSTGAVARPTLL